MPLRLDQKSDDFEAKFEEFLAAKRDVEEDVDSTAAEIIEAVRRDGDKAVAAYTEKFDRLSLASSKFAVDPAEMDAAVDECDDATIEALKTAATRIRAFHETQRPDAMEYEDEAGVRLGARWTALEAVGLYVPGGTASYPSSVLMNAMPAQVAGVERIVMVVPTPDGNINPLVLAAAKLGGVHEIYRIGGAQAVAALAYGTETIRPVDKIVGPGNAYVAAAKRRVFGVVGIDLIAGPSEILVVADAENDPDWIAIDLLSQAEHDTAAQSVLITDSAGFADSVAAAIERRLTTLPRSSIARESWNAQGAIVVVGDLEEAAAMVNRIAPEHLELATATPEALAAKISPCGRHIPRALHAGGNW